MASPDRDLLRKAQGKQGDRNAVMQDRPELRCFHLSCSNYYSTRVNANSPWLRKPHLGVHLSETEHEKNNTSDRTTGDVRKQDRHAPPGSPDLKGPVLQHLASDTQFL